MFKVEEPKPAYEPEETFEFINGADYLDLSVADTPWIVEPVLSPGSAINIYGAPKVGKSLLALQLASAISSGKSHWLRYPIRQHGPVLWFEADNPRPEWHKNVTQVSRGGYDLSGVFFADPDSMPYPFNMLDPEHQLVLARMVQNCKDKWGVEPLLTVFDTWKELFQGDESSSDIAQRVVSGVTAAVRPSATCYISHSRKGMNASDTVGGHGGNRGGQPPASDEDKEGDILSENRGSNYLAGKMQSIIRLTRKSDRDWGYFTAVGRSIGHDRFRVEQIPEIYTWREQDGNETLELARALKESNPEITTRALAKELADATRGTPLEITVAAARHLISRHLQGPTQKETDA